jgi:hypothetical protein
MTEMMSYDVIINENVRIGGEGSSIKSESASIADEVRTLLGSENQLTDAQKGTLNSDARAEYEQAKQRLESNGRITREIEDPNGAFKDIYDAAHRKSREQVFERIGSLFSEKQVGLEHVLEACNEVLCDASQNDIGVDFEKLKEFATFSCSESLLEALKKLVDEKHPHLKEEFDRIIESENVEFNRVAKVRLQEELVVIRAQLDADQECIARITAQAQQSLAERLSVVGDQVQRWYHKFFANFPRLVKALDRVVNWFTGKETLRVALDAVPQNSLSNPLLNGSPDSKKLQAGDLNCENNANGVGQDARVFLQRAGQVFEQAGPELSQSALAEDARIKDAVRDGIMYATGGEGYSVEGGIISTPLGLEEIKRIVTEEISKVGTDVGQHRFERIIAGLLKDGETVDVNGAQYWRVHPVDNVESVAAAVVRDGRLFRQNEDGTLIPIQPPRKAERWRGESADGSVADASSRADGSVADATSALPVPSAGAGQQTDGGPGIRPSQDGSHFGVGKWANMDATAPLHRHAGGF